MNDDPNKRRQFPHQRDLILHELVRRLSPQDAATILGIPVSEVNEALARPGLD